MTIRAPKQSIEHANETRHMARPLRATAQRRVHSVCAASSRTAPAGSAAQDKIMSFSASPARRLSGISNRVSQLRPATPHHRRSTGIWSPIGLSKKTAPSSGFDQSVADKVTPWAACPNSKEYQCASFTLQLSGNSPVFSMLNATDSKPSVPRSGVGPWPCATAGAVPMATKRAAVKMRMSSVTGKASCGGKKFDARLRNDGTGNGELKKRFVNRWSKS
ncbi:hypothetical protein SAMN04487991_1515 [Celeribacter neptunius]|uniref:Uncharacterized protein n=1 Tax=Celeribacter neptunius TaxID=588602 RepID=A0A1I3NZA6_9RHOB|nr:hypothetical protein SAMN04487991_1515 [Celeribacter neptunius]